MEKEEKEKIIDSLAMCAEACGENKIPHIVVARRSGKGEFCLLSGGSARDMVMMFAALMENSERVMKLAAAALALVAQSKGKHVLEVNANIKENKELN